MNLTYGSFIAEERIASGDVLKYTHDEQTGDGVTTLVLTSESPIGTATITVKEAGVTLPENTGSGFYTVDYQRGAITFSTAPASSAAISIDYQRAVLSDTTWQNIINDSVQSMTGEFWKEVYSTGATNTVANQKTYTLASDCLDLMNVWVMRDGSNYETLTTQGYNWRYSRDNNQLVFGNPYVDGGYPMQFHYLAGFTTATATTATIDIQERYKPVLQYAVRERYWQYRIQERVNITTTVSTERSTAPINSLIQVADYWHGKYLEIKRQLKPAKPPHRIPRFVEGAGLA